ncbi:MAG: hypothetical protein ACRCVV_00765 [Shewanella sp.]
MAKKLGEQKRLAPLLLYRNSADMQTIRPALNSINTNINTNFSNANTINCAKGRFSGAY